jgi:DNA helicase-2/ATP-dependent DNA helicase PcrA
VDYLQQIALFSDTDTYDAGSGKVSLMTLHCAKGLEFDSVFIIGLEQGILPHDRSREIPDELEEERRLFFVGITRARKQLCITLCRYRTVYGQTVRTIPSVFLYDAGLNVQDAGRQSDPLVDYDENQDFEDNDKFDERAFRKGHKVAHKKFGLGTIRQFHNLGEDSFIVVRFSSGHTKRLMLKYANLEIID